MWERQDGERDFSNDIQEARKLYFPVFRDWLYRRQDAIDNINEVMDEIRAELYWPNSMHSAFALRGISRAVTSIRTCRGPYLLCVWCLDWYCCVFILLLDVAINNWSRIKLPNLNPSLPTKTFPWKSFNLAEVLNIGSVEVEYLQ